jgi:hypothetical protein
MLGRTAPLNLAALLGTLFVLLTLPPVVRAHRLEAEYRVLTGGVQIESWFDLTGETPKGAQVQVFRPDGRLLTEGRIGEGGYFFKVDKAESLRVVVSAGAGHRKELVIPAAELERPVGTSERLDSSGTNSSSTPPALLPFADRSTRVSLKDILTGVSFLLAAAAFVLSIRNARRLRELSRQSDEPPISR